MIDPRRTLHRSLKIFWALLKIGVFILFALWLMRFESNVYIRVLDYEISMTMGFAVAALLIIIAVAWLIVGTLKGIFGFGSFWKRLRHRKYIKRAADSFDHAVNAFCAEEYETAMHDVSRAMKYNPGRTDLYTAFIAMSALKAGKLDIARDYFFKLTQTPAFPFVGYFGLYKVCDDNPISLLEQARLKTQHHPWILKKLFEAYAKEGHNLEALQKAQSLIYILSEKRAIDKEERRHMLANILWRQALYAQKNKDVTKALTLAQQSFEQDPTLPGPVIMLSEKELESRALKMLRKAFLSNPHPDLTEALLKRLPNTTETFHDLESDLSGSAQPEAKFLLAKLAFQAQLWGRAKQLLESIDEVHYDTRFYTLKAGLVQK